MKKRGFTLIELLAVIVVLAIIALIATPIVMNVIKNAQMGAAERSADNYVKAVETLIATEKLDGNKVADGEYTIQADGNLTFGTVEVSGTKPNGGTIVVENGQVVKDESSIEVGDYTVTFEDGKAKAEEEEEENTAILCKAIAPVEQILYDESKREMVPTVVGVQATEENKYAKGAVYQCDLGDGERIFYVLKDTKDTVSLLMEENIGTTVTWCDQDGDNPSDTACAADGAIAHLNAQTSGWTKLFSENGTATLPTYEDMSAGVFQDWMRSNLHGELMGDDDYFGYWTTAPAGSGPSVVYAGGEVWLGNPPLDADIGAGVRPVITISKENISL